MTGEQSRTVGTTSSWPFSSVIAWVVAALGSLVILKAVDALIGLRVPDEQQVEGLDLSQHGEEGYKEGYNWRRDKIKVAKR